MNPVYLLHEPIELFRERLIELTRRVQQSSIQFENGDLGVWLDACTLAAHVDDRAIRVAEILIVGDGWYRCWLRFVLALCRAEAARADQGALAIEALRLLTEGRATIHR